MSRTPLSETRVARLKPRSRAYDVRDFPFRYAPSAGGLQPVDLYVVANAVEGLAQGLYYHDAVAGALTLLDEGNLRRRMSRCTLGPPWVAHAHAVLVLVCNLARVSWKYGDRGYRLAHVDAGVLAQNLYLVGTALDLNTCAVAGFHDDAVHDLLDVDGGDESVVLLFAVGSRPAETTRRGGLRFPLPGCRPTGCRGLFSGRMRARSRWRDR